jgi:PmbA protein
MTTTGGFSGGYKKTGFQLFCSAIAGENSLMERDYASESRTFFEDLPDPFSVGHLAGRRAVNRLNPKKPLTGSYPVVFDERVSSSLIGHLTAAINGASISRGSSWLRDSLNTRILPKNFMLSEDPHRPRISGSRPFDSEGLPTVKKNFIEDGVLKNLILDLRSARKLNLKPLGNAYRSLSSPPQPNPGNLELSSGTDSVSDIIRGIKNGLLVTSLIGSTINPNTGDYSRGANGFWIQDGEIVYPVNECTIAGNLKEMLLSLTASNDGKPYLSRVVPSLLVESMTIAGL